MAGSVTFKDVARQAQVSIGTVSRVFNNHANVAEDIRLRVLKAATELGYFGVSGHESRVPETGRMVKEIGFLFCSIVTENGLAANPFWSQILHGVEVEARKTNIKVTYRSIENVREIPQTLLTSIYEMKLGGILLVGPAENQIVQVLQNTNIPLVLIDNYMSAINAVLGNNFEGALSAVNYLIQMGHRQIAFIGGPLLGGFPPVNQIYTIERRAWGYRLAMLDASLPISYELYESSDLTKDGGYAACKRLLEKESPFTAIFCANDEIAIGAMKALREVHVRVPEDVSLVGFDDIDIADHLVPALTTVRVNKEILGSVAVKRLLSLIVQPDPVNVTSVIDVDLVIRDSVKQI